MGINKQDAAAACYEVVRGKKELGALLAIVDRLPDESLDILRKDDETIVEFLRARAKMAADTGGAGPGPNSAGLMSVAERIKQPLPLTENRVLTCSSSTVKYPAPVLSIKEWSGVDNAIMVGTAGWLRGKSRVQSFPAGGESPGPIVSEASVAFAVGVQLTFVISKALLLGGLRAEWLQTPASSVMVQPGAGAAGGAAAAARSGRRRAERVQVEGEGLLTKPEFELVEDNRCKAFVEIKLPSVLKAAGTTSLAALLLGGTPTTRGRPRKGTERAVPHATLLSLLGQVEAYCRTRRTRYFAISTYEVTWLGYIRGDSMLISRGLTWDAREPTVLEALLFLSLEGLGQDGALTGEELPPRSRSVRGSSGGGSGGGSGSSSCSKDGGVSGSNENADGSALGGGVGSACSDGDSSGISSGGSGGGFVEWCVVPPSPGGGVLGSGISGEVLAGRLGGMPAAVKFAAAGSLGQEYLEWEAHVYTELGSLQDKFIPRLLHHGPTTDGRYVLVTSRVYGRTLRRGGQDVHLLAPALAALRAVHAAGYLHGDVNNLSNFMVVGGEEGPLCKEGEASAFGTTPASECSAPAARVVLLDFGSSSPSTSPEEQEVEEEELRASLAGYDTQHDKQLDAQLDNKLNDAQHEELGGASTAQAEHAGALGDAHGAVGCTGIQRAVRMRATSLPCMGATAAGPPARHRGGQQPLLRGAVRRPPQPPRASMLLSRGRLKPCALVKRV